MADAPVERLEDVREELTKAWLLRAVERGTLDEIRRMPTDRIARELPDLISGIVRAIADDRADAAFRPGGEQYRLAAGLAALRGGDNSDPTHLLGDIAGLQAVLVSALRRELDGRDPQVFVESLERLTAILGDVQVAALDELLVNRSKQLEWLANTDDLTGLYNVRFLRQHLAYLLDLQRRYGHPFALLLLDVNGLKRINDSYGHPTGDKVLISVADAIRQVIRNVDTPVRSGGDEFCLLSPHQSTSSAKILAQRVGAAVEHIPGPGDQTVTVSIGVATCPQHGDEADRLLESADEAMYRAKAAGERVAVGDQNGLEGVASNGY